MTDIEKDDKKFNDLSKKGHSVGSIKPFVDNRLKNDDEKMEDLLILQDLTETEPVYDSIEEKYEEEILIDSVTKMLNRKFQQAEQEGRPFFVKEEDEE